MAVASDIVVKALMQHRAELIGYAWMVVGDPDSAEDVLQDVSVLAIRKREEIEDDCHLIGWLYTAVRLRGMEVRRALSRDRQLLSEEALIVLEAVRASVSADARPEPERLAALRECINRLQGPTRRVLELRYGQNLKPAAIADAMGKKIQTIYKTITRAHGTLRDCVKQRLALREGGR